jgi:hypothetical protein
MELPEYTDAQLQERDGLYVFASAVTKKHILWRETPNSDVGIDGQIEYRNEQGHVTGNLAAVQIKSGVSYIGKNHSGIRFRPSAKHVNYWREFPVPVLLVIHDPANDVLYWTDARQQLRADATREVIDLPTGRTVSSMDAKALFETVQPISALLNIPAVVRAMALEQHEDPGFRMSFFELFGFGLADIGRKLFFSMSLCMEIAEKRAHDSGVGVGVGSEEHDFLERYIKFIVSQGLVYYDYSDYLIDKDLELAPILLSPLTARGRATLQEMQRLTNHAFHECFLRIDEASVFSLLDRLDRVELCQQALLSHK